MKCQTMEVYGGAVMHLSAFRDRGTREGATRQIRCWRCTPGLYALIIGVGNYRNLTRTPNDQLRMGNLDGPARTATRIAVLIESNEKGCLPAPCGRCVFCCRRVQTKPAKGGANDVTLFYFAGHGIRRGPPQRTCAAGAKGRNQWR